MRLTRDRRPHVVALVLAWCLTLLLPQPWAQAAGTVLDKDHTDAFYIVTDSGKPVVKVANGIRTDIYDPSDVVLEVGADTYSKEHSIHGLGDEALEGYFTGSWDAETWFEPGWNAPQFKEHGFEQLRIDFKAVKGPGKVALVGNPPASDEDGPVQSFLAGGGYDVKGGATLPVHGHEHAHWFFSHAGTYQFTGVAVGTKADGTEVASEPFTLTWRILKHADDVRADGEASPSEPVPSEPSEPSPSEPSEPSEPSQPAPVIDDTKMEIGKGHLDLFAAIAHQGKLLVAIKDDRAGQPVLRAPGAVTLRVGENTRADVPENLRARFGDSGYLLTQNGEQQQEALFPGWDTLGVSPAFHEVDLEFVDVQGPGHVFMFTQHPDGKLRSPLLSGKDALAAGEVIRQKFPAHVHTNWLFDEPGTYTMTLRATGVPSGADASARVASEPVTYTWIVGDQPSTEPTELPSEQPSVQPSVVPSAVPTEAPSRQPGGDTEPAPSEPGQSVGDKAPLAPGLPSTGVNG